MTEKELPRSIKGEAQNNKPTGLNNFSGNISPNFSDIRFFKKNKGFVFNQKYKKQTLAFIKDPFKKMISSRQSKPTNRLWGMVLYFVKNISYVKATHEVQSDKTIFSLEIHSQNKQGGVIEN